MTMCEPISINDLPKFSPWPARLLGAEEFVAKRRTPSEVRREYESEKWRNVLSWLRKQDVINAEDLLVVKV